MTDTEHHLTVRVAVLEAIIKEKESTLKIQAAEYERRLDALNHEHARSKEALSTYTPRETYDSEKIALDIRIRGIEKAQWVLAGAVALVAFAMPIVLHFWK